MILRYKKSIGKNFIKKFYGKNPKILLKYRIMIIAVTIKTTASM